MNPRYPSLYQINTRVWLQSLSSFFGRRITLDEIPDSELDRISDFGFEWIWLLGVWQTGEVGRQIALELPELRRAYIQVLPDYQEEDICSSPFAITGYKVNPDLGGEIALTRLCDRIRERGLRLMLDFIPNHTARDHPWVEQHPEFYIQGTDQHIEQHPGDYGLTPQGNKVFAHGRDPYFPGWTDTFQLNYGNPALQSAMISELQKVALICDGVRCDMAMLILPEVFFRTWGIQINPFWDQAIQAIQSEHPDFQFMAEVYWDLEALLQTIGFNYTYDKQLYDRLRERHSHAVREHLKADMDYQLKSARFLENHDEPRAAKVFPPEVHRPAALITYLVPGLRFIHQGQLLGKISRIPMQLCRAPEDSENVELKEFYFRLLNLLKLPAFRSGEWQLLESFPAWNGNWTWDNFIIYSWSLESRDNTLVVVNYSPHQGQCYVKPPLPETHGDWVELNDLLSDVVYRRKVDELQEKGLYLDIPGWGYHVFNLQIVD